MTADDRERHDRAAPLAICREAAGWGATVCFGARDNYPATTRRHIYRTRSQARDGDISDDLGHRGRIG